MRRRQFLSLVGGVAFARPRGRNDIVAGPGGSQVLPRDACSNLVELLQPVRR